MNHDTPTNYAFIPIGSSVVVQCKDGGLWTHGTIVGKGDHNHNNRSYIIRVTKAGWLITTNIEHMKPTQFTVKSYFSNQLDKHKERSSR